MGPPTLGAETTISRGPVPPRVPSPLARRVRSLRGSRSPAHGAPPPGARDGGLSPHSCRPSAGKPEGKAADKGKLAVKSAGLQRSSSDAGRDRLGDAKKPPSGIARPSTSGSFGYKKPPPATGTATVVQAGGSATLGKAQKTSGIPVKPANGRKTSLDVPNGAEPGFLAPGARSNIQYRSLPRPAKSSSMSVTGGRAGPRPVSSSIDPSLLSTRQGSLTPSRLKEPSKGAGGRATPAPVNQTDREKEKAKAKAVALDPDSVALKSMGSPESTPKGQASHPPAPKLAELPPTPLRYPGWALPPVCPPSILPGSRRSLDGVACSLLALGLPPVPRVPGASSVFRSCSRCPPMCSEPLRALAWVVLLFYFLTHTRPFVCKPTLVSPVHVLPPP